MEIRAVAVARRESFEGEARVGADIYISRFTGIQFSRTGIQGTGSRNARGNCRAAGRVASAASAVLFMKRRYS